MQPSYTDVFITTREIDIPTVEFNSFTCSHEELEKTIQQWLHANTRISYSGSEVYLFDEDCKSKKRDILADINEIEGGMIATFHIEYAFVTFEIKEQ